MQMNKLTKTAIMTAITVIITLFVRFPSYGGGYIHLGDCMLYLAIFMSMDTTGAIFVGGVGSALADLYGFPAYALPTFLIKSIAVILGAWFYKKSGKLFPVFLTVTFVLVVGYFITQTIMCGFILAICDVMYNLLQSALSFFVATILFKALKNSKLI